MPRRWKRPEFTAAKANGAIKRRVYALRGATAPVGAIGTVVDCAQRDQNREDWSIAVRWRGTSGDASPLDWFVWRDVGRRIRLLTRSETLFEEYLEGTASRFDPLDRTPCEFGRPDYLVHLPTGDVVCEVKEFGDGKIWEEIEELRRTVGCGAITNPMRWFRESLTPRGKLTSAIEQFNGAAAAGKYSPDLPFMVLLYGIHGLPNLSRVEVKSVTSAWLEDRALERISAVGILTVEHPALDSLCAEFAEAHGNPHGFEDAERLTLLQCQEIDRVLGIHQDDVTVGLRTIRNPNAVRPLPTDAFTALAGSSDLRIRAGPEAAR